MASAAPCGRQGALRCDRFLLSEVFTVGCCRRGQPAKLFFSNGPMSPFVIYVCLVETVVSTETCARNRLASESRSNYQLIADFSSSPRPRYYSTSMHYGFLDSTVYLFILPRIQVTNSDLTGEVDWMTILTAVGKRFKVDQMDPLAATPVIPSGSKVLLLNHRPQKICYIQHTRTFVA